MNLNPSVLAWVFAAGAMALMIWLLVGSGPGRVAQRLGDLAADPDSPGRAGAQRAAAPSKLREGSRPLLARAKKARKTPAKSGLEKAKERMVHAGFYTSGAMAMLSVVRLASMAAPVALGLLAGAAGYLTPAQGLVGGGIAGTVGFILPGFWLDSRKAARQTKIRRALPDALDLIAICLEGGLSLQASLDRVARELTVAHPLLATELGIVVRQVQLGASTGEGIRELSARFDLEELRNMSSVIVQAERIGSSIAGAIMVFSETLREKRQQRAEELAHKAAVKVLFPTLLFIFPAIFVVVLGPAAIQISESLLKIQH